MGDRVILHSDINCCYASIEHLHHPELAGKPLAVGGDPEARHGIVLTADYIAKKYGVKTGMALWQAKQVCPDITFVSPRMDLYLRFSRMAHEIYAYLLTKKGIFEKKVLPSAIKEESEDMQAIYFLYQQVMRELRSAQLKDQAMSQK